eukprot:2300434-Rhodomonas_salina.1
MMRSPPRTPSSSLPSHLFQTRQLSILSSSPPLLLSSSPPLLLPCSPAPLLPSSPALLVCALWVLGSRALQVNGPFKASGKTTRAALSL